MSENNLLIESLLVYNDTAGFSELFLERYIYSVYEISEYTLENPHICL